MNKQEINNNNDKNGKVDAAVLEAVQRAAAQGRLSCGAARKLARDLNVANRVIGDACDQLKIKIHSCELGCF